MQLQEIYKPIHKELQSVEDVLKDSLKNSPDRRISEINNYLLESPGKRIRSALVIFCAKASAPHQECAAESSLYKVAAAVELIHMASVIHDDIIDHARMRHNKSTINAKWGNEVSIALGDYLYSEAFDLIAQCGATDILQCLASATKEMCEGELFQVCERNNLELLKEQYFLVVKKKTAALFAASCSAGGLISSPGAAVQEGLKAYGLNFGMTFQIIDDYLDLIGSQEALGKESGQDIKMGEMTLPILNLLECLPPNERESLKRSFAVEDGRTSAQTLKFRFLNSGALHRTREAARSYILKAQAGLGRLEHSSFRESLILLADHMIERIYG